MPNVIKQGYLVLPSEAPYKNTLKAKRDLTTKTQAYSSNLTKKTKKFKSPHI